MGSSSTVTLTFDANTQAAVRAWQKMETAVDSLNAKINKTGNTSQRTGDRLGGMFDVSIGKIAQCAAGMVGVGSAAAALVTIANQLKKEWETLVARQSGAKDTQVFTAKSQRAAIGNLGTDKSLSIDQFDARVSAASQRFGVSPENLYSAASNAFSARGQLSAAQAMDAVEAAAEFAPDNPEGISTIAGSIMDLQKKNGGSAREQMGFIKAAQQSARVEEVAAFARNVAPAISQLQDFGNTEEESAELVSAVSQSMNDIRGEMTGSAVINLAKRLQEELRAKHPELKSTMQQLDFLQNDPEGQKIAKRLKYGKGKHHTGKIETEAKAYTTVHALLSPEDNATKQALRAAQEAIPNVGVESEAAFDKYLAEVNSRRIQQVADADRKAEQAVTATKLEDKQAAGGTARERLKEQLQASGVGNLQQREAMLRFEVQSGGGTTDPYGVAAAIAREQSERIATQTSTVPEWISRPLQPQAMLGLPNIFDWIAPAEHDETDQKSMFSLRRFADEMQGQQARADAQESLPGAGEDASQGLPPLGPLGPLGPPAPQAPPHPLAVQMEQLRKSLDDNTRAARQGGPSDGSVPLQHPLAAQIEKLQKSMDDNTRATRENSRSQGADDASPYRRPKAKPVSSNLGR